MSYFRVAMCPFIFILCSFHLYQVVSVIYMINLNTSKSDLACDPSLALTQIFPSCVQVANIIISLFCFFNDLTSPALVPFLCVH